MMINCDVRHLRAVIGGLRLAEAAELCGISVRTIKRWQQAGACPAWFYRLCHAQGDHLDRYGLPWMGWRIVGNRLVSPGGDIFTPGQLQGLRWVYGELRERRQQDRPGVQLSLDWLEPSRLTNDSAGCGNDGVVQGAMGWVSRS